MNWPQPRRRADVAALAVRVPRRREHRRAVVVEEVDLVVVEGDDDLALPVAVELPDPDVLPVGAVAVVADAVEGRVGGAVPRPAGRVGAGGGEDEDLRAVSATCWWSWPRPRCDRLRRGRPPPCRGSPGTGRRCRSRRASRAWAAARRRRGCRPPRCRRCRRRRSPSRRRGRGRRPRRARRPAPRSPCPCPGAGPSRCRRTCCRRARRSRASCRR